MQQQPQFRVNQRRVRRQQIAIDTTHRRSSKRLKPNEIRQQNSSGNGGGNGGENGGSGGGGGSAGGVSQPALPFPVSSVPEPVFDLGLTASGVSGYVRAIHPSYVAAFAAAAVNGVVLATFDDSDLVELGVSNKFHRRRILADVKHSKEMKSQLQLPSPSPAAAGAGTVSTGVAGVRSMASGTGGGSRLVQTNALHHSRSTPATACGVVALRIRFRLFGCCRLALSFKFSFL